MYIPHQPIPTITMENDLQTALESLSELEDQNPALEAFSIWRKKPDGKPLFDTSKLSMSNISSGSIKLLLKSLDNFKSALMNWRHSLSVEFNSTASHIFKLNEKRLKVYGSELKKYRAREKELTKEIGNRLNTVEKKEELEEEVVRVKEKIDFYNDQLTSLRQAIMVPQTVLDGLQETIKQCNTAFDVLSNDFAAYQNWIDIKEKDEHFQHGMLKDEKYRDMIVSLINHYHVGSETFDLLSKTKRRVIEIGEIQIYGGRNSNAPMAEYKFENVKLMLEQYDWLNKIVDKILKRIGIMRSMMLSIQAGKDMAFSVNELTAELVFLINFCSYMSAFTDSYLSAHTGIIYSYE